MNSFSLMEDSNERAGTAPPKAAATAVIGYGAMEMDVDNDPTTGAGAHTKQRNYYQAEKKFRCQADNCGRSFFSPHNVQQHNREAHTKEKPHACSICGENGKLKAFTRPASLYRHIRDIHKVDIEYERGKGVRKIVGPRLNPVPAAPVKASRQGQPNGRQTPAPGPEQNVYGASQHDFSYYQQGRIEPVGHHGRTFGDLNQFQMPAQASFQQQDSMQAVEQGDGMFDLPTQFQMPAQASHPQQSDAQAVEQTNEIFDGRVHFEMPAQSPVPHANIPMVYTCNDLNLDGACGTFDNASDFLIHNHEVHGVARSAECACESCWAAFSVENTDRMPQQQQQQPPPPQYPVVEDFMPQMPTDEALPTVQDQRLPDKATNSSEMDAVTAAEYVDRWMREDLCSSLPNSPEAE
ncbi:hypothetical protein TI39_contig485g00001 [Zymoseptoria brevis]|uniref:C2H2-type domain-containing protein n=1 Tax=Zymoseptoria brevis TaxID=1047168 RepID=A0A0F4GMU5_9PEZI|nr:hypothetical protein TI39_contig485g00001 [Zymoseptoria brevis]